MYYATCFEIYYSIPDAHDLSPDLLQVHIRDLLKLLNSFAHKLLASRCVSSALVLFIFIGEHLIYIYTAQAERFQLEDDRVLFMFRDGSAAWEAKDYLIEQELIKSFRRLITFLYSRAEDPDPSLKHVERRTYDFDPCSVLYRIL